MKNDIDRPLTGKNDGCQVDDCEVIVETINIKSIENEVGACEICGPDGAGY